MAIHDGLRLGSFMDGHEGTGYCFMDSHDPLGLRARDWGKLALCILKQRNAGKTSENDTFGQRPQSVGHGRPTVTAAME